MITLFRRKKKDKWPSKAKKKEIAEEKLKKPEEKKEKRTKKASDRSALPFSVLKESVISEKVTMLEGENKYVFKIFPGFNKNNVKRAIEEVYNVKVKKVNIIKMPGKKIRLGRTEGERPGYKKAIVTLSKGEKIEIVSR